MWQIFLIAVIALEVIADIFSKEWSLRPRLYFFAGSIICYLGANLAWLLSLKNGSGLARGVAIFSVACTVITAVIGLVFYREKLTGIQLGGVVLGVAALVMIFWEDILKIK